MSLAASIPQRDGNQRFKNWYIGAKGIPHYFHRLSGDKGPTLFRAIPEFVNGQEMPLRLKAGENELSSFICVKQGVSFLGLGERFACLTDVKGATMGSYEQQNGPVEKFVKTMRKLIKDNKPLVSQAGFHEWLAWMDNRGPLTRLEDYGFIQGAVFANGKMTYLSPDKQTYKPLCPTVMQLTQSAWQAMLGLINQEVPGYAGHPEDYNNRYACGDLLSSAGGKMLTFNYHPASNQSFPSYSMSVGQPVPLPQQTVSGWWRPWDEVLNYLTVEEQFRLLINHFPGEALDYVFAGTPYHKLVPEAGRGSWSRALQPRSYVPQGYQGQPQQSQPQMPQMPPQMPQPGFTPAPAPMASVASLPNPMTPAAPTTPVVGGIAVDLSGGAGAGDETAPWVTGGAPAAGPSVQMGGAQPNFPPFPAPQQPAQPAQPQYPQAQPPQYPQAPQAQPPQYPQAPQPQMPAMPMMPQAPQAVTPAMPASFTPLAGVPPLNPPPTGSPAAAQDAMAAVRARLQQAQPNVQH
jgi:hypothetical protein